MPTIVRQSCIVLCVCTVSADLELYQTAVTANGIESRETTHRAAVIMLKPIVVVHIIIQIDAIMDTLALIGDPYSMALTRQTASSPGLHLTGQFAMSAALCSAAVSSDLN